MAIKQMRLNELKALVRAWRREKSIRIVLEDVETIKREKKKMSAIDDYVVRNGKWVSSSETETIPGETCISISDGYGFYVYELGRVPEKNARVVLVDAADNSKECTDFDYMLVTRGLPKLFGEEEE